MGIMLENCVNPYTEHMLGDKGQFYGENLILCTIIH